MNKSVSNLIDCITPSECWFEQVEEDRGGDFVYLCRECIYCGYIREDDDIREKES